MNEQQIQQEIRLAVASPNIRLFRNNVGKIKDATGRLVTFGLCNGSADLIGFKSVTITPEMVGQNIAVFVSLEVKTPKGKISEPQQAWCDMVARRGGIAGICRSVEEAKELLK
jgi:hypothetical protein